MLLRCFRLLRAVKAASTAAFIYPGSIQLSADDGVAESDIFHTAAAHEYHRVLLQIVPLAGYVGGDLHAVGEAYARDFADSTVWLTRRLGGDAGTNTALERSRVEGRTIFERIKSPPQGDGLRAPRLSAATPACELIDCSHCRTASRFELRASRNIEARGRSTKAFRKYSGYLPSVQATANVLNLYPFGPVIWKLPGHES